jgi:hypothetical protein
MLKFPVSLAQGSKVQGFKGSGVQGVMVKNTESAFTKSSSFYSYGVIGHNSKI